MFISRFNSDIICTRHIKAKSIYVLFNVRKSFLYCGLNILNKLYESKEWNCTFLKTCFNTVKHSIFMEKGFVFVSWENVKIEYYINNIREWFPLNIMLVLYRIFHLSIQKIYAKHPLNINIFALMTNSCCALSKQMELDQKGCLGNNINGFICIRMKT
jgi:hypothetical protein